MSEPSPREADRVAHQVLTTRLNLKPNENVTIEAYPSALPWAAGFVREARRLGARPVVHYEDERAFWAAVDEGRQDLIGAPGSHEWATLAKTDVYVYFWGPEDQGRMNHLSDGVAEKLTEYNDRWYTEAQRAGVRGVRMGIARVTEQNARRWGVSLTAWRREMVAASSLDPRKFIPASQKLRKAFERGHEARIVHANGTDLTLALSRRKALIPLGMVTPSSMRTRFGRMASVPDGSVYVAVDESTANGTLVSNRMSGLFGDPVRGGEWMFRRGRLTGQRYSEGAASVRQAYARGGKGRDRPSMLEVGLDPSIRISPNMEENERGAVSVGLGSNAGFGGATRCNFVAHLTVAGAELRIDGRTVVKDGRIA